MYLLPETDFGRRSLRPGKTVQRTSSVPLYEMPQKVNYARLVFSLNACEGPDMPIEIMATLWPDMPHFDYFAKHPLLNGIRLNTAMATVEEVPDLLAHAVKVADKPLYFDVKGRQLRITKIHPNTENFECDINHKIELDLSKPVPVIMKGGNDVAVLGKIEDGNHLVFIGGPRFNVKIGESLNIRSPSLKVTGRLFTDQQLAFLDFAKKAGIKHYMLSYATRIDEMEEIRRMVGPDAEVVAKIENPAGFGLVKNYRLGKNEHYLTARGDLFVEMAKPHQILAAAKAILKKDPSAILGSRILLSLSPHKDPYSKDGKLIEDEVPSCADINEVAWLLEIGYKRFMFCDGLCLKKEPLERAINVLHAISEDYKCLAS